MLKGNVPFRRALNPFERPLEQEHVVGIILNEHDPAFRSLCCINRHVSPPK